MFFLPTHLQDLVVIDPTAACSFLPEKSAIRSTAHPESLHTPGESPTGALVGDLVPIIGALVGDFEGDGDGFAEGDAEGL